MPCISHYNVLLGQSNVQRVWFGSVAPISYSLYQVRVSVCMFEPAYPKADTNPKFRW